MKRIVAVLVALLALAASAAGAVAHTATPVARSASAVKVDLHHTSLGTIVSTSSGFTLYEFTRDHGGRDSCVSLAGCTQTWPPLTTSGRPIAGPGIRASLLSTTKIAGGRSQVTYAGHPLYRYAGDSRPGDTEYVAITAFGGQWYALNSSGHTVK